MRPLSRALITALVGAASLVLLFIVAPPGDVFDQVRDMDPIWVLGAIGFELASCLSYVVVFRRFFPEPPGRVSREVAWTAMGAGAVLPGGNISSAAATGWLLRGHGIGTRRLIERCAALLCLLTAFGFFVNGAAGVLLLAGVPGGPHDLRRTALPILVSVGVLGVATLVVLIARRRGAGAPAPLRELASGLEGAWNEVVTPHWRLLGVAGFLGLDMAALWAAGHATGHPLGVLAVVIAYCIGYLATIIPVPAGLGVLDSGLTGSLVIYGLHPTAAVSAVLVYHAIAIWIPGLGGLLAWLRARRRVQASHEVAIEGSPLIPVVPAPAPLRLASAGDSDA